MCAVGKAGADTEVKRNLRFLYLNFHFKQKWNASNECMISKATVSSLNMFLNVFLQDHHEAVPSIKCQPSADLTNLNVTDFSFVQSPSRAFSPQTDL